MIVKLAEGSINTKYGVYKEYLYYDGQKECIAIVMGEVEDQENVLCRVHSSCIAAHNFNSIECDCREQMELAQQMIQEAGQGIIVWLDQEGKANGHFALLKSKDLQKTGLTQTESYEAIGFKKDARDFTKAAEIIKDLGVKSIVMMTNNPKKINTLAQHGIVVAGTKPMIIEVGQNEHLRETLAGKIKDGHAIKL